MPRSAPIPRTRSRRRARDTSRRAIASLLKADALTGREDRRGEEPVRRFARGRGSGGASIAGRSRRCRRPGAEIVDVSFPALEELMRGSSVIDAEFKFDLMRLPRAVAGRAGALARRDPRSAATTPPRSRRCSGAATRGRRPTRRTSPGAARSAPAAAGARDADDGRRSGSTCSPTRRCAARRPSIGEPQRGGENCQLSAEHRTARDQHAGRVYRRRRAGRHRTDGRGVERAAGCWRWRSRTSRRRTRARRQRRRRRSSTAARRRR